MTTTENVEKVIKGIIDDYRNWDEAVAPHIILNYIRDIAIHNPKVWAEVLERK